MSAREAPDLAGAHPAEHGKRHITRLEQRRIRTRVGTATNEEHEERREAIEDLRVRDREYLAEQLGDDPEADRHDAE